MSVDVQVPVGGEGAEDYVLVQWYAASGDRVIKGDALFEIETAKATHDVPTPVGGVLTITVAAGTEVSAHQVVGTIADEAAASERAAPVSGQQASGDPAPVTEPSTPLESAPSGRVAASPRARVAAKAVGADLATVVGTGPSGRVLARDIPAAGPVSAPGIQDRSVIARRMTESAMIPAVTLHRWCDGTVVSDVVTRLRTHADRWGLPRISVGDVLAAVVARVLPRHPDLNAHWVDEVRRQDSVHLGIAVDAPKGLMVPVVRDAQRLPIGELSATLADLAARVRDGTVRGQEVRGSTFTITNLGATGVEHFTPLLNPPEVAILGIGSLVPHRGAESAIAGPQLPLSLTFDHRAVDGAPAARFLADVAAGVEAADVVLVLGDGGSHRNRN